jgi:Mg2+-importing ATPase
VLLTLILPITPVAAILGFTPLPMMFLVCIGAIVLLYIGAAEAAKRFFYRRVKL